VAAQVNGVAIAAHAFAQLFLIHRLPGDAHNAQVQLLRLRKLNLRGKRASGGVGEE